jgi:hypothetical protein
MRNDTGFHRNLAAMLVLQVQEFPKCVMLLSFMILFACFKILFVMNPSKQLLCISIITNVMMFYSCFIKVLAMLALDPSNWSRLSNGRLMAQETKPFASIISKIRLW